MNMAASRNVAHWICSLGKRHRHGSRISSSGRACRFCHQRPLRQSHETCRAHGRIASAEPAACVSVFWRFSTEKFTASLPKSTRNGFPSRILPRLTGAPRKILQQGAQNDFRRVATGYGNNVSGKLGFCAGSMSPCRPVVFATGDQHPSPAKSSFYPLIQRTSGA
jgi:hypothetical protein